MAQWITTVAVACHENRSLREIYSPLHINRYCYAKFMYVKIHALTECVLFVVYKITFSLHCFDLMNICMMFSSDINTLHLIKMLCIQLAYQILLLIICWYTILACSLRTLNCLFINIINVCVDYAAIRECLRNFIPHTICNVSTYPCYYQS